MRLKAGKKSKVFLSMLAAVLALGWWLVRETPEYAIAELANPTELRTLGERGANSRLNQIVFWLYEAEEDGRNLTNVLATALWTVYRNETQRDLVQSGLLRNFTIARQLGLLTNAHQNVEQLQRGRSATITIGPYAGEKTEVDHIVPRSLAPELDNELANLELMPASLNRKKSDRVTSRQVTHAEKLFAAGLLMPETLERVRTQAQVGTAVDREP
jgi:hypothetical protein